jgi:hypothetical protein
MPKQKSHKRRVVLGKPIQIDLPHWLFLFYGFSAAILLPWVVYLSLSLPTHQVTDHWDITWSGFDIIIIILLVLSAYFLARRSILVIMSSAALSMLLITDAWFDVMTARPGKDTWHAILLAGFIELPVALLSLYFGVKAVNKIKHGH